MIFSHVLYQLSYLATDWGLRRARSIVKTRPAAVNRQSGCGEDTLPQRAAYPAAVAPGSPANTSSKRSQTIGMSRLGSRPAGRSSRV
jgi:hypothetical protein